MVIDYIPAGTPAYEKFRQQRAGASAFQDYIPAKDEPEEAAPPEGQEQSAQAEPEEELVPCPICQKEVKPKGVHAHIRKAHPDHQFIDGAWALAPDPDPQPGDVPEPEPEGNQPAE